MRAQLQKRAARICVRECCKPSALLLLSTGYVRRGNARKESPSGGQTAKSSSRANLAANAGGKSGERRDGGRRSHASNGVATAEIHAHFTPPARKNKSPLSPSPPPLRHFVCSSPLSLLNLARKRRKAERALGKHRRRAAYDRSSRRGGCVLRSSAVLQRAQVEKQLLCHSSYPPFFALAFQTFFLMRRRR